jgi:prolyl-tRNA synthetase
MLAEAIERRDANIADATTLVDAAEASRTGWARVPYDLVRGEGETRLASESVTVRCVQRADGSLPESDDEPELIAYVGRSY